MVKIAGWDGLCILPTQLPRVPVLEKAANHDRSYSKSSKFLFKIVTYLTDLTAIGKSECPKL